MASSFFFRTFHIARWLYLTVQLRYSVRKTGFRSRGGAALQLLYTGTDAAEWLIPQEKAVFYDAG
jgi:hypothetical protein